MEKNESIGTKEDDGKRRIGRDENMKSLKKPGWGNNEMVERVRRE